VSISTDGNVLQWSLKKGLLVSLLMQLKRGGAGEGWISRQAAGLCLDFCPSDPGTYITGTEEGNIHKCSVSYNEQYLDTYESHSGPVYRLRFSPWWNDVFLSCSADWNVSLFHLKNNAPLLTFHSSGEDFAVNDICWAPRNSTIFAAVTADAKLQIWDISVSEIDPVASIDVNLLDAPVAGSAVDGESAGEGGGVGGSPGHVTAAGSTRKTGALASGGRRDLRGDKGDDGDGNGAVAKLIKNLSNAPPKKMLTTVLFAENSPIAVVGDSHGGVTVFRINEPVIMQDIGHPMEQINRMKDAIFRQADPVDIAKIQTASEAHHASDH